jgi:hypothetical protein
MTLIVQLGRVTARSVLRFKKKIRDRPITSIWIKPPSLFIISIELVAPNDHTFMIIQRSTPPDDTVKLVPKI